MGLEIVELIPVVEDAFGLVIPAEDAAGLCTLEKLQEYVLARRFRGYPEDCLCGMAFYKLRRAMTSALGIAREDIGASSKLSELIPSRRRGTWKLLRRETGLRLPPLRRPGWVAAIASPAAIGLGVALPVVLSLGLMRGAILTALLAATASGILFAWLTKPLAFEFPPECATMDQLASLTLALNYRTFAAELNDSISDNEVRDRLRAIAAERTDEYRGERLSAAAEPLLV